MLTQTYKRVRYGLRTRRVFQGCLLRGIWSSDLHDFLGNGQVLGLRDRLEVRCSRTRDRLRHVGIGTIVNRLLSRVPTLKLQLSLRRYMHVKGNTLVSNFTAKMASLLVTAASVMHFATNIISISNDDLLITITDRIDKKD